MLLRRVDSGLLGARHLCGGSRHGCEQGGGSARLADAAHSLWISWTHRLLQEVHSRIRRHRPVDTVTQTGVLPMVIRSGGGLRRPQECPHIDAGTAATAMPPAPTLARYFTRAPVHWHSSVTPLRRTTPSWRHTNRNSSASSKRCAIGGRISGRGRSWCAPTTLASNTSWISGYRQFRNTPG
jgi:ribosome modulation factor